MKVTWKGIGQVVLWYIALNLLGYVVAVIYLGVTA